MKTKLLNLNKLLVLILFSTLVNSIYLIIIYSKIPANFFTLILPLLIVVIMTYIFMKDVLND